VSSFEILYILELGKDMDFDSLNFDEIQISVEDLQAKAEALKEPVDNRIYYLGMGNSRVRLVPYFSKKLQKWDFDALSVIHRNFLSGEDVLCVRETYREQCPICELMFKIGRHVGFRDRRFGILKSEYNLNTKFRHYSNIIVREDSGDSGSSNFQRPKYPNGWQGKMYLTADPYKGFIQMIMDPEYGPIYHPTKGRDIKIAVVMNPKTMYRESTLSISVSTSPLAESEEKIKEILKNAEDLTPYRERPSLDKVELIKAKAEEILQKITKVSAQVSEQIAPGSDVIGSSADREAMQSLASAPAKSATEHKTSTQDLPVDSTDTHEHKLVDSPQIATKPLENGTPVRLVPTSDVDPSTKKPLCFQKNVYNSNNPTCQLCVFEHDCAVSRQG